LWFADNSLTVAITLVLLLSLSLLGMIPTKVRIYYILMLPVITLALIEILPVIKELLSLLNFETTDLLTDNFELKFEFFMFFVIYGFFVVIYDTNLHRFQR
jgi:hypothetical protein